MISYWEQKSFIGYDHIVIGAGIVGLSVAIELKELFPDKRVLILERGLLPTGASTRNAGFACTGSFTELLDDLTYMSQDEVIGLFKLRKEGLSILRRRLGDERIDFKTNGSYELLSDKDAGALDKLNELNQLLLPVTGETAFIKVADSKIKEFGFSGSYVKAMIENTCEGELNSGKMMRVLTDLVISKGVEIKTGADVKSFEEKANCVFVSVKDPFRADNWIFNSSTMSICTNAFTKQLLPEVDVIPGRGQVLITKPVKGLKFKGIYHFDKGYYYFREINDRVLFGGGRNLDFATEATTEFSFNKMIQDDLEQKLKEIILPTTPFETDMRWSGIMAFGTNKYPIVKSFSDRVFGAFRMGGMGVAMGNAPDDIKAIADYVTDTNNNDGVQKALVKFFNL